MNLVRRKYHPPHSPKRKKGTAPVQQRHELHRLQMATPHSCQRATPHKGTPEAAVKTAAATEPAVYQPAWHDHHSSPCLLNTTSTVKLWSCSNHSAVLTPRHTAGHLRQRCAMLCCVCGAAYYAWLGTWQMRAGVWNMCPGSRSARGPRQPSSCSNTRQSTMTRQQRQQQC